MRLTKHQFVAFSFVILGCKSRINSIQSQNKEATQIPHNALDRFRIAPGRNGTHYVQLSREEIFESIQGDIGVKSLAKKMSDPVPLSHSLSVRMQNWADEMDTRLRATLWGQKNMAQIPKPHVLIIPHETFNAFNFGVPVVYQNVDFAVPEALVSRKPKHAKFGHIQGELDNTLTNLLESSVTRRPTRDGDLGQLVERWNIGLAAIGTNCLGTFSNPNKVIFMGPDCENSAISAAESIKSNQSANGIVFFTQLLKDLSEEEAVGVLAHELGHYYRAHAADTNSGFYDFVYKDDKASLGLNWPAENVKLSPEERSEYAKKIAIGETRIKAGALDGEIYNSELFLQTLSNRFKLSNFVDVIDEKRTQIATKEEFQKFLEEEITTMEYFFSLCNTIKLEPSYCNSIDKLGKESNFQELIQTKFDNLTTIHKKLLVDTQKLLKSLFIKLIIDIEDLHLRNGKLSIIWYQNLGKMEFAGIDPALHKLIRDAKQNLEPSSFDAFLIGIKDTFMAKHIQDILKAREDLQTQNVGWFTVEQEADMVAVQLLTSVGLSPKHLKNMFIKTLKSRDRKKLNPLEADFEKCNALLEKDFLDDSYKLSYVKTCRFGSDTHHSDCYRVFNIHRIEKNEKFVLGQSNMVPMEPSQYKILTESAHGLRK